MAWVKTRQAKTRRSRVPLAKRSQDRRLICIDQGPLRQKAASECARLMARVEQARSEWERFGREDEPAFGRWMAATFGTTLTRLREMEARALEKESLLMRIETEIMFTDEDPHQVYQRIEKERAAPPPDGDPREGPDDPGSLPGSEPGNAGSEGPGHTASRDLFKELLRNFMGLDPKKLSKAEYDRMFQEFQ